MSRGHQFKKTVRLPRAKPVVDDPNNPVFVDHSTTAVYGLSPHVELRIGSDLGSDKEKVRTSKLTARQARDVPIRLLEAAQKLES
jgi:hypothetical protein